MSNKTDHRKPKSENNQRQDERKTQAHCCAGEGKRGALGRSDWRTRSRRSERRVLNAGNGKAATITKRKGHPVVVDIVEEFVQ
jgi:hypothetical protein